MPFTGRTVRPLLLLAGAVLLVAGCAAPVVFHDGLPAWAPGPGSPEATIGYHRMYFYDLGHYQGSTGYLTPGFRIGLARPPTAADIGLTSVVYGRALTFAALVGATLGLGYQSTNASVMIRPSAYFLAVGTEGFGADWDFSDPLWQVSLLAGNGNQLGATHVSAGGRVGELGIGPVLMVDRTAGGVNLRFEASYMFPRALDTEGRLLTVGFTVGGPAPQSEDEAGSDF